MSNTVMVTGAGGYLGTMMVPYLLKNGWEVIALDRYFFGDVYRGITNRQLHVVKDDIRTFPETLLKNADAVIHLASISNDPAADLDPELTTSINFEGTVRVATLAKRKKVKKFIFSSSCSVYGLNEAWVDEQTATNPVSLYAQMKVKAEKEVLSLTNKNFSPTVLRLATLYGLSPRRMRFDLLVNIMTLYAWKLDKIYVMQGGTQWRPLVHIEDAIDAFVRVLSPVNQKVVAGEIFNVGANNQNYQVSHFASMFRKHFPKLKIEEVPSDPENRSYRVNFSKIAKTLGFTPRKTVDDGIREIKEALEMKVVTDSVKTSTLKYYQYLMKKKMLS